MSRQYPDSSDIEFLTDWAERKILAMTPKDRAMNFGNVAEFTRIVAFYLNTIHLSSLHMQTWLRLRISDTYYALSEMQYNAAGSEKFDQAESSLIDTLKYIAEFYEENGFINPGANASGESAELGGAKEWRKPTRWLMNYSSDLDSLE
jgi:hypothetical protein